MPFKSAIHREHGNLLWIKEEITHILHPLFKTPSKPFDQLERSTMSTISDNGPSSPSLQLSSSEFHDLVTPADTHEIYELLLDHPDLLPYYIHFSSLSRTLECQKLILQAAQDELDMAFDDMKDHDFYDAFSFFIARKQNEQ
jgi:hypothetical protein